MTVIKNQTSFLICLVVIVGLLLEWFNKTWLFNNTNYSDFYAISSSIRAVLLILTAMVIYKVKGSFLICLFMLFNLCAIFLNILYIGSTDNYNMLHEFRQGYFAPIYRAVEMWILLWTGRDALSHLSHIVSVVFHRLYFVVTRWFIHDKAERL